MRTMFWCSLLSAALAAGACKKSQDDTGKAAKDVKKTQENVQDQRKELEKQNQPDRNATEREREREMKREPAPTNRTPTNEQQPAQTPSNETDQTPSNEAERGTTTTDKDRAKKQADLDAAKADAKAARDKYSIAVQDRLQKIDIRMKELQQRGDAKSQDEITRLKQRRDEAATEANSIKTRPQGDWDAFTKDLDNKLDSLEKDINDAMK